ncbi:MAG: putative signal transducing protein [Patescibacteria group bacterium]
MALVCIRDHLDRIEAEMAKGLLAANGIEATISADDCGGTQPPLQLAGFVRLLVQEEDEESALEILRSAEEDEEGDPPD